MNGLEEKEKGKILSLFGKIIIINQLVNNKLNMRCIFFISKQNQINNVWKLVIWGLSKFSELS